MKTTIADIKPGSEIRVRGLRWSAGWEFDGKLESHDPHYWDEFRGWSPAYLRRKFYRKQVERIDIVVTFVLDEDGEFSWVERPVEAKRQ